MEGKWGTLSATERDDGREEGESGPGWAVMNSDGDEGGRESGAVSARPLRIIASIFSLGCTQNSLAFAFVSCWLLAQSYSI